MLKYPLKLILPTDDLVVAFLQDMRPMEPCQSDVLEVMMQIIFALMNDQWSDEELLKVFDANRIVDQQMTPAMRRCVPDLALSIRDRLRELNAYEGKSFPFFFDRLLGKDVILTLLPY
jgi:hypothetical protein